MKKKRNRMKETKGKENKQKKIINKERKRTKERKGKESKKNK
jgi:hypothetical protein